MRTFQVTGTATGGFEKVHTLQSLSSNAISKLERLFGSGFHKITAKEDKP